MINLSYTVAGQLIEPASVPQYLVADTVGVYQVAFTFDADWADMGEKMVVFRNPQVIDPDYRDVPVEFPLDANGQALVPAALLDPGKLFIGVYGTNSTQQFPTIWAPPLQVVPGASPGVEPSDDPALGTVIRTIPQTLTEEEKAQARENIGANEVPGGTPGNLTSIDNNENIEDSGVALANVAERGDVQAIESALDAEYPNLWDCNYADLSANGIVIERQIDGTYHISGTATALTYRQQSITLPPGEYAVNGFTGGATGTYHLYITGANVNYQFSTWTPPLSITTETTITITLRILSGVTLDVIFKPILANVKYRGVFDYIQYGKAFFPKTVDTKINGVINLTGYTKPNLFNNTIQSISANGLVFTVNSDKSVTITGTSTALSAPNAKCTLPRGSYILNGCPDGSTQTYHIMVIRGNGALIYQHGGNDVPFEVTDETETITLYVRVLAGKTVNTTMYPMIRPASVYNPTYAPYGEYQVYKPIQQLIDYTEYNWSGKKMNVIGDSIVQGSYGNFINVIRDILCLSVARNYGVGGSCLTSSDQDASYPPAVLRYSNMDLDAQIIVVHAGTNDYSAQIPLGDDTSTDITTFNGALNVMMSGLRDMYPTALIIFDSILHRFNDSALVIPASAYRQAIESRCLANHIVFYDAYKYSGFDFVKGYYDHILTSDGLHPNQTGADILGRKLAGFIRWN